MIFTHAINVFIVLISERTIGSMLEVRMRMMNEEAIKILKGIEMVGGSLPEDGDIVEEALLMAIKALEQQPKTGWIPCSERLPEENGNYLVTVEVNAGTAKIKYQMVDHYGPKWLLDKKKEKVIAWMPLPDPYKVESEENNDDD